jgi:hypothetical protein
MWFHHHHDSRCPDADGGNDTSKAGHVTQPLPERQKQ